MTNRLIGVYDDTGDSANATLAKGEILTDAQGRLVTGDGQTVGGVPHVTRYPINAFQDLAASYANAFPAFRATFASGTRIKPLVPLFTPFAGQVSVTAGARQVPWMWAIAGVPVFYEDWQARTVANDVTGATTTAAFIASDWAAFKGEFTQDEVLSPIYGVNKTTGLSDDISWVANAFRMIHEVTGDATALSYLVEYIAAGLQMYRDTGFKSNQPGDNAIIDYGVSTPGGIALKSNARGILYSTDVTSSNGFGYISGIQEMGLAYAARYVSKQPTTASLSAPLKAAYALYARQRADFALGNMLVLPTDSNAANKCVPGLPYCEYNLDRNVVAPQVFHRGKNAYFGRPCLDICAQYDSGAQYLVALCFRLFEDGAGDAYRASALSIVDAYADLNGFGRIYKGSLCIASLRDCWGPAAALCEMVRLTLVHAEVEDHPNFFSAILNTARNLGHQSASGLPGPDWAGPESPLYNTVNQIYSWLQVSSAGQSGNEGQGQGNNKQIMVAGAGIHAMQAGMMLLPWQNELASGSDSAASIETLTAQVAALAAQVELLSRPNPYRYAANQTVWFWNSNTKTDTAFFDGVRTAQFAPGVFNLVGNIFTYANPTTGGTGSINAAGDVLSANSVKVLAGSTGSAIPYGLGPIFGNPGIAFDNGDYVTYATGQNQHQRGIGNAVIDFLTTDRYEVIGAIRAHGTIGFSDDNAYDFGEGGRRARNIYGATGAVSTSDANHKTVRGPLNDQELAAAKALASMQRVYQFNDAIVEKGEDARLHCGWVTQQVMQALVDNGLDPARYGFICIDSWPDDPGTPEQPYIAADPENGIVGQPFMAARPSREAGTIYSLRYEELLAFVSAGQEQRLAALEAR